MYNEHMLSQYRAKIGQKWPKIAKKGQNQLEMATKDYKNNCTTDISKQLKRKLQYNFL